MVSKMGQKVGYIFVRTMVQRLKNHNPITIPISPPSPSSSSSRLTFMIFETALVIIYYSL